VIRTRFQRWRLSVLIALLFSVCANDASAIFIVNEPWVRTAKNAKLAEAYMVLTSTEGATLVGVRCEVAERIEIFPPGTSRGAIDAIDLPAGKTVMLAPRGNRLVLSGLGRALKLGDRVPIVLIVAAADGSRREIPISAEVRLHSPTEDHLGHRHSH
jgi:copper(I)-binding protein